MKKIHPLCMLFIILVVIAGGAILVLSTMPTTYVDEEIKIAPNQCYLYNITNSQGEYFPREIEIQFHITSNGTFHAIVSWSYQAKNGGPTCDLPVCSAPSGCTLATWNSMQTLDKSVIPTERAYVFLHIQNAAGNTIQVQVKISYRGGNVNANQILLVVGILALVGIIFAWIMQIGKGGKSKKTFEQAREESDKTADKIADKTRRDAEYRRQTLGTKWKGVK